MVENWQSAVSCFPHATVWHEDTLAALPVTAIYQKPQRSRPVSRLQHNVPGHMLVATYPARFQRGTKQSAASLVSVFELGGGHKKKKVDRTSTQTQQLHQLKMKVETLVPPSTTKELICGHVSCKQAYRQYICGLVYYIFGLVYCFCLFDGSLLIKKKTQTLSKVKIIEAFMAKKNQKKNPHLLTLWSLRTNEKRKLKAELDLF